MNNKIKSIKIKNLIIVPIIMFVLIFGFMIYNGIKTKNYIKVDGYLIKKYSKVDMGYNQSKSHSKTYYCKYEYKVNGDTYYFEDQTILSFFRQNGEKKIILYNPSNPKESVKFHVFKNSYALELCAIIVAFMLLWIYLINKGLNNNKNTNINIDELNKTNNKL